MRHEASCGGDFAADAALEYSSANGEVCYKSRAIVAESAWNVCRQRSGRGRGGLFGGFAGLLEDFALGADPVFQGVAGSAVALEIDFVGALRDFLLRGRFFGGGRFALRR